MFSVAILSFALAASANKAMPPQVLNSEAACRLIKLDKIPSSPSYVIEGTYNSDGIHGSYFEVPNCQSAIFPTLSDDVSAKVQNYHWAFKAKCGGILMGDRIVGVFTGHFQRKMAMLYGFTEPLPVDFFVITNVVTKDLDAAAISCPEIRRNQRGAE